MFRAWWARAAAASGVLSAALSAASLVVTPRPPGWTTKVPGIETYLLDHRTGLEAGRLLSSLSGLLLLLFVVYLWSVLRQASQDVEPVSGLILAGGSAAIVLGWVQSAVILSLVETVRLNGDGGFRIFYTLANLLGYVILYATAALLAGTAAAVITTDVLPRWLGGAAAVLAAIVVVLASGGFFHPSVSTNVVVLIAFIAFLVWQAVTSILLTVRVWRSDASSTRPATTPTG